MRDLNICTPNSAVDCSRKMLWLPVNRTMERKFYLFIFQVKNVFSSGIELLPEITYFHTSVTILQILLPFLFLSQGIQITAGNWSYWHTLWRDGVFEFKSFLVQSAKIHRHDDCSSRASRTHTFYSRSCWWYSFSRNQMSEYSAKRTACCIHVSNGKIGCIRWLYNNSY